MLKLKRFSKLNLLTILIFLLIISLDLTGISSNFSSNIIRSSNYISAELLPILITVLTMFFAVYLLVVQLFRGRYPVDFIRKYFRNNFSIDYIINIFIALILVVLNFDFVLTKFIYILHFLYVFYLFFRSYNSYRVFDPAAKIGEFEAKIKKEIDQGLNEANIYHYLEELDNYSEDSLLKNEIFLSRHILKSYKNLIIYFLQNKSNLIINNQKEEKDKIDEIEKSLFKRIIVQYKTAVNLEYKDYTEEILSTIYQIIKVTVDCDKLTDHRSFAKQLKSLFSYTASQDNILSASKLIGLFGQTANYISEAEKLEDWKKEIKADLNFFSFNTSEIYSSEKLLEEMFRLYYNFLEIVFEDEDQESYQELTENIFEFIKNTFPNINNTSVKYFKIFNGFHTSLLVDSGNYEFIKLHLNFLEDVGRLGLFYDNEDIYRYVLSGFDFIIEKNIENVEINKLVNEYKFTFVLKMLEHKDEFATIFVPDYKKLLENNNPKDMAIIEEVIKGFRKLLNRSLMTKNKILSYYLFEKLNEIVLIYEQQDKACQHKYLELYKETLHFGLYNKEGETFHMILNQFQDLFLELDKENKLSEDLCETFIEIYQVLNISALQEKMVEFSISINHKLDEMRQESKLLLQKKDLYYKITDALFRIGIRGVENGMDEIIRNSSNRLGWIGRDAIENSDPKILKNVLEKAVNMLNLCHEFKINERTKIFNGTLFVILGGIAQSLKNFGAVKMIRDHIYKINCASNIYSAKLIRGYESEHWNDKMGGRASACMEKFFQGLDQSQFAKCE